MENLQIQEQLIPQLADPAEIVRKFNLEPGMRVADFGAGSGYFALEMAKAIGEGGLVSAIDILDSALEMIKTKVQLSGLRNIQVIKGNLEVPGGSTLPDESQDFVLLANILFQNGEKAEIVKEAKRVLKEGRKMVVIDWEKGVSGLGPPDEYRTNKAIIISLVNQEGLIYEKEIFVDPFHFGLMFRK